MFGKKEVFLILIVLISLVVFNINKEDITGKLVRTETVPSTSSCLTEPTPEILYNLYSQIPEYAENKEQIVQAALQGWDLWTANYPGRATKTRAEIEVGLGAAGGGIEPNNDVTGGNLCNSPEDDMGSYLITKGIIDRKGTILDEANFVTEINLRFDMKLEIEGGINRCKYINCQLSCESTSITPHKLRGKNINFVTGLWIVDEDGIVVSPNDVRAVPLSDERIIYNTVLYDGSSVTFFDRVQEGVQDSEYHMLFTTEYPVQIEFGDGFKSNQRIRLYVYKEGNEIRYNIWPVKVGLAALDKREVDNRLFTVTNNINFYYVNTGSSERIDITPSNEEISDELVETYSELFENLVFTTKQELNPFITGLTEIPVIYYYSKQLVKIVGIGIAGAEGETAVLVPQNIFDELFSGIDLTGFEKEKRIREAADEMMSNRPVKVIIRGNLLRAAKWFEPAILGVLRGQVKKVFKGVFKLDETPEWNDLAQMVDLANTPLMIIIERDESGVNSIKLYDEKDNLIKTVIISEGTLNKFFEKVSDSEGLLGIRDRLIVQYLTSYDGTV